MYYEVNRMTEPEGILPEKIIEWQSRLQTGESISTIAKTENRAYSVIARAIRVAEKRRFRHLTSVEREIVKQDYRDGLSITAISNKRNFPVGVVWYAVKKVAYNKRQKQVKEFRKNIQHLSDFDIGYLIGVIEGEGCLNINAEKDKEKIRYRCSLAISNCDKIMVDYIRNMLQANVYKNRIHLFRDLVHLHEDKPNWNKVYEFRLSDKMLLKELFAEIMPKMISKKEEAKILLEMLNEKDNQKKQALLIKLRKVKGTKNSKVNIPSEVIKLD